MENIQKPEILRPNKDVIEMTKAILFQHQEIIKINATLSVMLANPMIYVPSKTDNNAMHEDG